MNTREKGMAAETVVITLMEEKGYRLLVRNFSVHNVGELDAVMRRGNEVAVVEVKERMYRDGTYSIYDTVTPSKMRKIRNTTSYLIRRYRLDDCNIRFFVGLVTATRGGLIQNVEIFPVE